MTPERLVRWVANVRTAIPELPDAERAVLQWRDANLYAGVSAWTVGETPADMRGAQF
jgi:hypothetical protein